MYTAILDNELDLQATLEIEAHLEVCPHCQTQMLQLSELKNGVRQKMDYYPASDSLKIALQQRLGNNPKPKPLDWPIAVMEPV